MDEEFVKKLLALYPSYSRVYGPYQGKKNEGRRLVILYRSSPRERRGLSWPRAMMEVKLGRRLTETELVDHIDDNPTGDDYDNFQILTYSGNAIKAVVKNGKQEKIENFV